MRRREFIGGIGTASITWSLAAQAQQLTTQVIGILATAPTEANLPSL